jgi:hypothetical protein
MKKFACFTCLLLLLLTTVSVAPALAMSTDYSGDWVWQYVDLGDGALLTEYEGQSLQDSVTFTLQADGTALLTSFGEQSSGIWQPTGAGIAIIADSTVVPFSYTDGQLVNVENGITMYFVRAEDALKQGGFSTLISLGKNAAEPAFDFTGEWHAVSYAAMGIISSIDAFFPDGLYVTFAQDGTGTVQLTPDYSEAITWSKTADGIAVEGSNFLYGPVWDPDAETLSMNYASDMIQIIFEKIGAPEPTVEPVVSATLPQVYTCAFFTLAYPDGWVEDTSNTYNYDTYYSAQVDLNDADGWSISNVRVEASTEEVSYYRGTLDTMLETANEQGKEQLDELTIGGIIFQGLTTTTNYWSSTSYVARVPEASLTLKVSISSPDMITDVLPDILASINFTFSIPNPPLSDPPLPEDGVPYQPVPSAVTVGDYDLKAEWLPTDTSLLYTSTYNSGLAAAGDAVYILSGKDLHIFNRSGNQLISVGDPVDVGEVYNFLSVVKDGTLFITDGFYSALSYKDGVLQNFDLDRYLTMHPDGQWGLAYWSNYNVQKITFTADGMATKYWVLTNLSDDATRTGRFSSVSYVAITDDRIFVAGADTSADNYTRIAMYDFDGNELATFGSVNWLDDSYISSVVGIVQTANGILVLDKYNNNVKLFKLDGTFLGNANCDTLLGTVYPWAISMVASDNGAIVLMSQERNDQSATDLLAFEITGF